MSSSVTLIGYLAACCTTFSFLPQVIHTFKTKSVADLHVGMLVIFSIGVFLWTVYGVFMHSWPIILCNGITLAFQIPLIVMKLMYDARKRTSSSR